MRRDSMCSKDPVRRGAWIHSRSHRVAWVDDHAQWIRRPGPAFSLGLSEAVVARILAVDPVHPNHCRPAVLLIAMDAGFIRFRGHGPSCALESTFSLPTILRGAERFRREFAGPELSVDVHDLGRGERLSEFWRVLAGVLAGQTHDQFTLSCLNPIRASRR